MFVLNSLKQVGLSMSNKPKEENFSKDVHDETVLKLIFEESKGLRNEFADRLIYNTDKIWSLQNVLVILFGAYITFFTFIFGDGKAVFKNTSITCPMFLCFFLLGLALYFTLKGIVPKYKLFAPDPENVYAYIGDNQKKVLEDFISTYLNHYKETLEKIEEMNALRNKIIRIEVYSIIEFAFSALIYILDTKYMQLINIVSLLALLLFFTDYMNVVYSEEEINSLSSKNLNSEK